MFHEDFLRKYFLSAILIAVFFLPLIVSAATAKLTFGAWVPYWKPAAIPETIANLDQFTSISPFSYEVKTDGTLVDKMKIASSSWQELISSARAKKIKVIPSIMWNDGTAIHSVLSVKTKRDKHIAQIVDLVVAKNFDGIDIDYEGKKTDTINHFSTFLKDLSAKLHLKKKTLVCTIEARTPPTSRFLVVPDKIEYANDYVAINKYCDEVRLMTYDQTTYDIKLTNKNIKMGYYAPVADVAWVRKVVAYTTNWISPKKLSIGLANYGYEFEVTDKVKYYDYKKIRSLTYKTAAELAKEVGAKPTRNSAGEMSFTYKKDGKTRLVWYSDSVALGQKIQLAKNFGLRGVALFKVDGESDPLLWSGFALRLK